MAGYVGIDIGKAHVRAASVAVGYKRLSLGRLEEVALDSVESLERAVQIVAAPLLEHADALAVAINGDHCFMHRIAIPATAAKRLEEVLPFEIEAQVPVDIDELVYDYRPLRRRDPKDPVVVMTAAARIEAVRSRIDLIQSALSRQPDRVGCGPLSLANLAAVVSPLRGPGPFALVDLGAERTEVTVLEHGQAVFVRTLSQGVAGLPGTAAALASELRQTFLSAAVSVGSDLQAAYLIGGGSAAHGAAEYLAYEAGVPITPLPALELEGVTEDRAASLPRFAKAVALALGASGRARDVNLRKGPLEFQRGFGFLKEKLPVLSGLGAAIAISFVFSNWAEMRALDREHELLAAQLGAISQEVLGEPVTDAEGATEALTRAQASDEADPLPQIDAFDMMVKLSEVIPAPVVHDIEEFDMQRGHLKVAGVVGSTADAQNVATEIGKHPCVKDAKIGKITQVVNSERQKYTLDLDVRCVDESKKKKEAAGKPSAEPAGEGAP
ncbi:MAG TPA: pilus assembly protein PilM [Polyangiaceae bacterium]|nr:pilus assembly protein PilM [Polyangiaceae bacterium]